MQTLHHTATCRKKKGVRWRFKAPWVLSVETRTVSSEENMDEAKVIQNKKRFDEVLFCIVTLSDLPDIRPLEILEKSAIMERENNSLECVEKQVSIVYKRKLCEVNKRPDDTVILKLFKSSVNVQFATGTYQTMLMVKIWEVKCILLIMCFWPSVRFIHIEQLREYYLYPCDIQDRCSLYPYGPLKNRTRMLKLRSILEKIYPGDANTFISIIIDKYENRLDELHSLCLADEH